MRVVALEIWNIRITKVNESLNLGMLLPRVNDGLGYLVHRLKDWHKTLLTHTHKCS